MNGMIPALIGGALIGLAASLLLLFQGRIAGISGITGGIISPSTHDKGWRLLFVVGLLLGGATMWFLMPGNLQAPTVPSWLVVIAGLLVGFGVSLGNGCTSGHGVCGISRTSRRSLVATATFLGAGMITASLLHGGV